MVACSITPPRRKILQRSNRGECWLLVPRKDTSLRDFRARDACLNLWKYWGIFALRLADMENWPAKKLLSQPAGLRKRLTLSASLQIIQLAGRVMRSLKLLSIRARRYA